MASDIEQLNEQAVNQADQAAQAQSAGTSQTVQVAIPNWEVSDLYGLSQAGKLSGIPVWALAGMAENESGGEVAGPGVNSKGYGGYFGDSDTVIPYATLNTASQESFESQAQTVAAQLAKYGSPAGPIGDVAIFNIGGGPTSEGGSNNGIDWQGSQDAQDANAISNGVIWGNAPVGLSGGGTGTPSTPPAPATAGSGAIGNSSNSQTLSQAVAIAQAATGSNSSLYRLLQQINGLMNPGKVTKSGSGNFLSNLLDTLIVPGAGLGALLSGNLTGGTTASIGSLIGSLAIRAAFAFPAVIVMLAAAGITVLGIGSSGPVKSTLEVVDLAKVAGTKASSIGSKKG